MFKCTKCLNEKEYRLVEDFRCVKCNDMLYNCKKCHFIGEEGFIAECDECESEYYVNGGKQCSSCYYENLPSNSGRCYYCSTKSLPDYCYCESGYALFNYSCYKCPENCFICEYDPQTKSTKCLRCSSGYIFNSAKECINCGYGCEKCLLDRNSQPLCFGCYSGYTLEENLCLSCPDGCSNCKLNSDKTGTVCINCNDEFIFDPKTNKCIRCADIDEIGSGCSTCRYNILNEKYECITCKSDYYYYYSYGYSVSDYTFVQNTFQCLSNTDPDKLGLYGCITAEYMESSKTYQCLECKNYTRINEVFIFVINEKYCIEQILVDNTGKCLEAEKIGEVYSCTKCASDYAIIEDESTHIKKCYARVNNLVYCLKGKLEEGNQICTECVENASLDGNKCKCNSDSFSKDKNWCYKCDNNQQGNPGCDNTKGCVYFSSNDRLNCYKCKDGYFEYTEGECFSCSIYAPNCGKCSYKAENDTVKCESCLNSIYKINTEDFKCELNECEEYPEISPGCIICKDKLNEYKQNNKCQRCKYGYFKTKAEKCVLCSSEENGGHACSECAYEKTEQGTETENIICKGCYPTNSLFGRFINEQNQVFLTNKGKCYNCQVLFSDKCNKCDLIKNSDGTEKFKMYFL